MASATLFFKQHSIGHPPPIPPRQAAKPLRVYKTTAVQPTSTLGCTAIIIGLGCDYLLPLERLSFTHAAFREKSRMDRNEMNETNEMETTNYADFCQKTITTFQTTITTYFLRLRQPKIKRVLGLSI